MKTISPGSPLAAMLETGVALELNPGPPVIPKREEEEPEETDGAGLVVVPGCCAIGSE